MNKYDLSVTEFLRQSHSGNIDYNDFIINYLEALKEFDKKLRLMQCINEKTIRPSSDLYGLPVTVKDNICTAGMQSSAGSKILQGYVPPFDATSVARIKDAGGFIAGKSNQDEFGFGTFSTNSAYGIPKNPHDPERAPDPPCGKRPGVAVREQRHRAAREQRCTVFTHGKARGGVGLVERTCRRKRTLEALLLRSLFDHPEHAPDRLRQVGTGGPSGGEAPGHAPEVRKLGVAARLGSQGVRGGQADRRRPPDRQGANRLSTLPWPP